MTDLQRHAVYVSEHPEEKASALALVDHTRAECGFSEREALRHVATIRTSSRRTQLLARAAEMLAADRFNGGNIAFQIRVVAGWEDARHRQVVLVSGFKRPRITSPVIAHDLTGAFSPCVTVGSRWVLRYCRLAEQYRKARRELDSMGVELNEI